MANNFNLGRQAGGEPPIPGTEDILRQLGEQAKLSDADDGVLDNPELEQLFGSLSKGLEEGADDGLLSAEPVGLLTLEEISRAKPATPATVACEGCGSRNPAALRFCGMCGHELGHPAMAAKDAAEHPVAAAPLEIEQKTVAARSSGQIWKMATLGLLCLVLGLVVAQHPWWQSQSLRNLISMVHVPHLRQTPPAPSEHPAEPKPASVEAPVPAVQPSVATAKPPVVGAKPPKTTTASVAPAAQPAPKLAVRSSPPAAQPVANKPESQALAPVITAPALPVELPTIIKPPSASPSLYTPPIIPKVSQVAQGTPIYKVNPQYPPAARNVHVQGAVVLRAMIATDGSVRRVQVVNGSPLLVNAAVEAVKKWRYQPFLLDGKPVEGETTITVTFKTE